ncbi:MAG: SRPBCC family protein [Dehalococcoidia bacterium]
MSGTVEREIHIDARPEIVFGYFTDAERLLRWQGQHAEIDARPGGTYRVQMNIVGDLTSGEFLEVRPYDRIVYTWGWERGGFESVPPGSSTIEITLRPDGGGTHLTLLHTGLPDDEELISAHRDGWAHYLSRLAVAATGADPGPDPAGGGDMSVHRGAATEGDSPA